LGMKPSQILGILHKNSNFKDFILHIPTSIKIIRHADPDHNRCLLTGIRVLASIAQKRGIYTGE
jgi:hypothetical protein